MSELHSLMNIIEIYLENPSDKDMERVLERESTKNNTVKMYEKIKALKQQLEEAREEFSIMVDNMEYFTQRELMSSIKKVMTKLKENKK